MHAGVINKYIMIIIYIYKNKTSSKKYIGYTERSEDFYAGRYLGSGEYWQNHCKLHGGYDKENLELIEHHTYDSKKKALEFIDNFEKENNDYWLSDEWANVIPETLEKSPFKGNMSIIFAKHGNPFSGGEIQRKAHADGKYTYDFSENAKKGWINRDREKASIFASNKAKKWIKENTEEFANWQKNNALKSKEKNCQRLKYKGKVHIGWSDLSKAAGISSYKLKKYHMNDITILCN
jgi:hypothetical protein